MEGEIEKTKNLKDFLNHKKNKVDLDFGPKNLHASFELSKKKFGICRGKFRFL